MTAVGSGSSAPLVAVLGRVGVDFVPAETDTALEDVSGFTRAVGGFGGNVSVGLARLGVCPALFAMVGDDGHGRFVRNLLEVEAVDVRWLGVAPHSRTPLAFFECHPPDSFPVTFYPSATYWANTADRVAEGIMQADAIVVSGTEFAHEPARSAALTITADWRSRRGGRSVLDLDWRPALWSSRSEYQGVMADIATNFDIVVGGVDEFSAARMEPRELSTDRVVVVKRGPGGATVLTPIEERAIAGIQVDTVCGLGSGDAFLAAFVAGVLAGVDMFVAASRGNAAGAIVATRMACSVAMPRAGEIDGLLLGTRTPPSIPAVPRRE